MTLQDGHTERSYFYPNLELKMRRIIDRARLSCLANEIIAFFCRDVFGDHSLDNARDYKAILVGFQNFVAGIRWREEI